MESWKRLKDDGACSSNQCADRCCKPETRDAVAMVYVTSAEIGNEEGWLPKYDNVTLVDRSLVEHDS